MSDLNPNDKCTENSPWERDILEKLVFASVTEQRRTRRWGIFFKLLLAGYLGVALWLVAKPFDGKKHSDAKGHTAVVDVTGMIADGSESNADKIIEGLRDAIEDKGTKGIVLRMNTPGGSPVQSAYVYEEIRRLKKEHPELPIHAVVSDLCASGGYYIASATDKIFVSPASVIGSIGVIMNGFGFVDAMSKLGVERRLVTAGEHKALLDPFSPVSEPEKAHIQGVINGIHRQFIDAVKQGRGDRLKNQPDLFSGLVWTGDEGIKLGLADEVGDVRSVAKNVIGAEEVVNFTVRERLIDRVSQRIGSSVGHTLQQALGLTSSIL